jgi:hypothetical protein
MKIDFPTACATPDDPRLPSTVRIQSINRVQGCSFLGFNIRGRCFSLIFSGNCEIPPVLPGKSPAKRNPMRHFGSHSYALCAAAAWSSERPGDRCATCVGQAAGNLISTGLTRQGSTATD